MLQAEAHDTFVLAKGHTVTVRVFEQLAFKSAGINIEFEGQGESETGIDSKTGKTVVRVNPAFYRPAEVELLVGDASKANTSLGWQAKTSLEDMCAMMVQADLRRHSG